VLVNLAPFIGSLRRQRESVPCRVLAVDGRQVEVLTEFPCRDCSLWVASSWIDGGAESSQDLSSQRFSEDDQAGDCPSTSQKGMHHRRRLSATVG
jgi:hypothetical protein